MDCLLERPIQGTSRETDVLGNVCGVALVLFGFFLSSNSSAPIWDRDWKFYVGVTLPCVFGLIISLAMARLCRLKRPSCLAVAIEVCYQNTAIPLAVILNSFSDDPKYLRRTHRRRGEMRCGRLSVRCPDVLSNGANIFVGGLLFALLEKGGWALSAERRIVF